VEGLRAIAAGSLVLFHGWLYTTPDGPVGHGSWAELPLDSLALGVILFFTLSGFLLYRPYATAVLDNRPLPSARAYFANRALRIVPAYWFILVVTALVFRSVGTRDSTGALEQGALTDPGELLQTALLLQNYTPETLGIGIGPAWTLAVEVAFYAILPVLGLFAWQLARHARGPRGRLVAALAPAALLLLIGASGKFVAGVVVPAYRGAGYNTDWHSVIERSLWGQADLFSFGMALAVIAGVFRLDGTTLRDRHAIALALAAAALALAGAASINDGQLSYLPGNTLVAAGAAGLLALVVLPRRSGRMPRVTAGLEARPLVLGGLISYSVFLWNEPLAHALRDAGLTVGGAGGLVVNLALLAAVVGLLSALTYLLVERPALRHKVTTRSRAERELAGASAEAAP
jgi:peptidoglycan/LPS O-acetylase OafA/YrhL